VAEPFTSLASLIRVAPEPAPSTRVPPSEPVAEPAAGGFELEGEVVSCEGIARELALMRLAVAEALERCGVRFLEALAEEVLGRELAFAPPDAQALAGRALATFAELQPLALRLAPADAAAARVDVPVRADATLARGDVIVEVRDGALESHFAFRLSRAREIVQTLVP
jgi:hypothetical protein